jgi:hypothetical protein
MIIADDRRTIINILTSQSSQTLGLYQQRTTSSTVIYGDAMLLHDDADDDAIDGASCQYEAPLKRPLSPNTLVI